MWFNRSMIAQGLYRHYKNQQLYRVLFVTTWGDTRAPVEDGPVSVAIETPENLHVGVFPFHTEVIGARWSGNLPFVKYGDRIVIYVALYEEGRVAARPESEFEATINGSLRRFARVG